MLTKHLPVTMLLALALISATATADTIDLAIQFSQSDLSFTVRDGYYRVDMRGLDLTGEPGQPQLPVLMTRAVIPPNQIVQGLEILEIDLVDLVGRYDIAPAQPPQILSLSSEKLARIPFVEPEEALYRSREPFPRQAVQVTGHGYLGGYHLADLEIYPLSYLPAEGKLRFCREITFRLMTTPGEGEPRPTGRRSEGQSRFYQKLVDKMVLNPADVSRMAPVPSRVSSKTLPPGDYEYVIITQNSYLDEFQPLADWKGQKGIPDTIVTREWIEANYSGYDVREKIRNFIIDAYSTWGTQWVLLGGDTNVIPSRTAFAMKCEAGFYSDEDSIRADLYFADLDGTWDLDGDHIYGEVADSVDLYPEVFVGRASVSSQTEAQAWVNKLLLYERTPQPDQALKMLFLAEVLWGVPTYTDGGVHKNMIDDQSVPPRFDPIKKLYESLGNETADSVRYYINQGQNLINHDGHCWFNIMSMGSGSFVLSDMDSLSNGDEPAILYSIGCWPAAFDKDCIAEHFVNNPNGGGVAFIGNSRYGWGSPNNPGYGYSDIFDSRFFHELFVGEQTHIGAALAAAKLHYAPKSRQANVYRIHQYQVNLLGDPEMPVWTDTPASLAVTFPGQIPQGPCHVEVTVTDGSEPVAGALVCARDDGGLYEHGLTGLNGQIVLALTTPSSDSVAITVTAQDYLPHLGSIPVILSGPHISRLEYTIDDQEGNGNGEINPGEVIDISVTLKNYGAQTAESVSAILRSGHAMVTVLDSAGAYGDLAPGDAAASGYQIAFSQECADGQVFYLELEVQDQSLHTWASIFGLVAVEPRASYIDVTIDDGGDDVPQPGEQVDLELTLQNIGLGVASGTWARLAALDPYAAVLIDSAFFGDVQPESSAVSGSAYRLAIADSCPDHHQLPLKLDIFAVGGYSWTEGLSLAIGTRGFSDDMEAGQGDWTHGGNKDHWHLSSHRSHSGSTSWYCGFEDSLSYEKYMNAYLLSPEIILGPNSTLTFWTWYDVPIYGSDGLYVVIGHDAQWDTLDFFGSGGALDSIYMGNDWLPDEYDLSGYDTVQVKLIFRSDFDEEPAEGFYIDDVVVTGAWMASADVFPPQTATDLILTLVADTALVLSWSPPGDEDIDHYDVYRDTLLDFGPATANYLGSTADTLYLDEDIGIAGDTSRSYYYLVRVVDSEGNTSDPSHWVGEFDRSLLSNP